MQVVESNGVPVGSYPSPLLNCLYQRFRPGDCRSTGVISSSGPVGGGHHPLQMNGHFGGFIMSGTSPQQQTHHTRTHVFSEEDRIGTGGTCDVFCGLEKGTGQRHALKVLREPTLAAQTELLREAETLVQLSHPKIVKFFRQDVQLTTGLPIIVSEYCSGGSLLTYLLLPEKSKGLEDDEFLTLLSDMVDAISYLRSRGFVHRDIKPGNILRSSLPNGKFEYKLSDFGTSREAADKEQMHSIVGTEEYLHPVLYETAFFGHGAPAYINPTSGDLWSLGCTLYHAIAGSVPFRPVGGARNNRQAMLYMVSQKPPGAISGEQTVNGTLRWSKDLPEDCRLSESLRKKVTPLVQNLMETDTKRQWNFGTLLDESQIILSMRRFHVCDTECGDDYLLYLRPKQSLAEMQDDIAFHTELPAAQQLLFHRIQPISSMMSSSAMAKDLPDTDPTQPLLLVSRGNGSEGRCRRENTDIPQPCPRSGTLKEDVDAAFTACSRIYFLSSLVAKLHRLPNTLFFAILALRTALTSTLSTVETRFRVLSATCQERQTRLTMITQLFNTFTSAQPMGSSRSSTMEELNKPRQLCTQLREELWQLKFRLDEVRKCPELNHIESLLTDPSRPCVQPESLENIFKISKEIWQRMNDRKHKIPLSEIEQEKHKGDKEELEKICIECVRFMEEVIRQKPLLLEEFCCQKRQLLIKLGIVQEVESELLKIKEESERFSTLLNELWAAGLVDLRQMADSSRESVSLGARAVQAKFDQLLSEDLPDLETFSIQPDGSRNVRKT